MTPVQSPEQLFTRWREAPADEESEVFGGLWAALEPDFRREAERRVPERLRPRVSVTGAGNDVFERAAAARHTFRGDSYRQFRRWAVTIVVNRLLDQLDTQSVTREVPATNVRQASSDGSDSGGVLERRPDPGQRTPGSALVAQEELQTAQAAMERLEREYPNYARVIRLKIYEALSFVEIAVLLGDLAPEESDIRARKVASDRASHLYRRAVHRLQQLAADTTADGGQP